MWLRAQSSNPKAPVGVHSHSASYLKFKALCTVVTILLMISLVFSLVLKDKPHDGRDCVSLAVHYTLGGYSECTVMCHIMMYQATMDHICGGFIRL